MKPTWFYDQLWSYSTIIKGMDEYKKSPIKIGVKALADKVYEVGATDNQLQDVVSFFTEARNALSDAFNSDNLGAVRQYLSDDFPQAKYLEQLYSLRSKGWNIELNGNLSRPTIKPVQSPGTSIDRLAGY